MAVPVTGHVQRAPASSSLFPLGLLPAIALITIAGLAGAALDVILGNEVRLWFGVGFGIGAGVATLIVDRRDIVRTIIAVPLAYSVLLLIGTGISGGSDPLEWLILAIVFKAPVVMIGWSVAVVIGLGRTIAARSRS
jgi:hypothetical protein